MAASGSTGDETETTIDVSGFMRAFTHDDDDDGVDSDENNDQARSGDISMFCKACLHPYFGEQKAGTIVLRCERCGQTDTVLEERIDSLNPQEWIGNLMMNRFLQVVKEQEDISANLTDPLFANDEFQKITLALSEYTFNIEKLSAPLFDIAKKTRVATDEDMERIKASNDVYTKEAYTCSTGLEVVLAMNATRTLIEIHKMLILSEPAIETVYEPDNSTNVKSDVTANQLEQEKISSTDTNEFDITNKSKSVEESEDVPSGDSKSVDAAPQRQEMSTAHAEGECENTHKSKEYKLLEHTRERLNHIGQTIMKLIEKLTVKYKLPNEVWANVEERLINKCKAKHPHATENKTEDATEEPDAGSDGQQDDILVHDREATCETTENIEDGNDSSDESDDESRDIFNISTKTIKDEVFSALAHKLKLRFDETPPEPMKFDPEQANIFCSSLSEMQLSENENIEKSSAKAHVTDGGVECPEETVAKTERDMNSSENDGEGETYLINFYSFSTQFIRELQNHKGRALRERRDTALGKIRDKIDNLKKEMEKVEEAVTKELTLAYERKMKKVEKQKQQLHEKHEQVKRAERLLDYYAMTGQQDKVAELAEQFNNIHEN